MQKWVLGIMLLVSSNAYSTNKHLYEYEALSVSVFLNNNETIEQAVHRAESMLQINAVTMTPKFVSHDTHYDSRTDEIVEKGLIAQGANVRVLNTQHEQAIEDGKIVLHVTADVSVDVSAMQAKLGSQKRERLLESTIDDLSDEYQKLSGVLDKMKRNITLSNLDSIVVTDYYSALNSSMSVIDGDAIKQQLRAHQEGTTSKDKLSNEIKAAYEMFVFPFMANPTIDYQVLDIIPHEHAVAEVKVHVTIDRKGVVDASWYPSESHGASESLCSQYFYGCDDLMRANQRQDPFITFSESKRIDVKEVLRPKYCGDSLYEFLPYSQPGSSIFADDNLAVKCGSSINYRYKDMVFYQTGYRQIKPASQMPKKPEMFTEAFKSLSNTAFWLVINIGSEKFKLNISNLFTKDITLSAYMPEKEAVKGVKVSFSIQREVFDINTLQWKDMSGKFLRYQSRKIGFY